MNTINFFNYFHNGDMFVSKEFVRQIIAELPDFNFGYYHLNHFKTTKDLNIQFLGAPHFRENIKFVEDNTTLNINTWIGAYQKIHTNEPPHFWNGGINLICLYDVWSFIFEKVNSYFDVKLKIKDSPLDYIPTIIYEYFDLQSCNDFIANRKSTKKILFSNGKAMSGQSFDDDMVLLITDFAKKYPNHDYICTKKFQTDLNNIFFTDDIFEKALETADLKTPWNDRHLKNCDLNEISYLSNFCEIIVGKNSGPFVYCMTKENFLHNNKYIISFNRDAEDSMAYGINLKCKYIFSNNFEYQSIVKTIEEPLCHL
jgi:hypothetical protein